MTAKQWNARYPVGTAVTYFPIRGELTNGRDTRTRSEAWALGSGHAVVLIEGLSGGVSLEHLSVVAERKTA